MKKFTKRLATLALVAVSGLSLAACGGNGGKDKNADNNKDDDNNTPVVDNPTPTPTEKTKEEYTATLTASGYEDVETVSDADAIENYVTEYFADYVAEHATLPLDPANVEWVVTATQGDDKAEEVTIFKFKNEDLAEAFVVAYNQSLAPAATANTKSKAYRVESVVIISDDEEVVADLTGETTTTPSTPEEPGEQPGGETKPGDTIYQNYLDNLNQAFGADSTMPFTEDGDAIMEDFDGEQVYNLGANFEVLDLQMGYMFARALGLESESEPQKFFPAEFTAEHFDWILMGARGTVGVLKFKDSDNATALKTYLDNFLTEHEAKLPEDVYVDDTIVIISLYQEGCVNAALTGETPPLALLELYGHNLEKAGYTMIGDSINGFPTYDDEDGDEPTITTGKDAINAYFGYFFSQEVGSPYSADDIEWFAAAGQGENRVILIFKFSDGTNAEEFLAAFNTFYQNEQDMELQTACDGKVWLIGDSESIHAAQTGEAPSNDQGGNQETAFDFADVVQKFAEKGYKNFDPDVDESRDNFFATDDADDISNYTEGLGLSDYNDQMQWLVMIQPAEDGSDDTTLFLFQLDSDAESEIKAIKKILESLLAELPDYRVKVDGSVIMYGNDAGLALYQELFGA